jgi:DNA-binding transcriptional LysR family regulator
MVDWGSAFGIIHAEKFPNLPAPVHRTNSGEIALGLLQTMGGAAYLPRALVSPLLKNNSLYEVAKAPVIKRLAYVIYRPENIERDSLQKALEAL